MAEAVDRSRGTDPGRPLASVCVVTYNHAAYIRQCLESVICQAADCRIEVLVGVDVSDDGTGALVEDVAQRHPGIVRAFVHENRLGAAGNVRFLMARANGEFIAHLDGDDAWLPGKLAEQLELLARYPEAPAAYCNATVVDAGSGRVLGRFSDAPAGLIPLGRLMRRGNFLNNSSLLFRSEARPLLQALPDEYLDFRSHLTLATKGPLVYSDKPLVLHRWSTPGSLVSHASERVRELYWQALSGVPWEMVDADVRRDAYADFLRRVAFRSVRERRLSLWKSWWPRVRGAAPGSSSRLAMATLVAIAWESCRQLANAFSAIRPGRRVFYHHGGR